MHTGHSLSSWFSLLDRAHCEWYQARCRCSGGRCVCMWMDDVILTLNLIHKILYPIPQWPAVGYDAGLNLLRFSGKFLQFLLCVSSEGGRVPPIVQAFKVCLSFSVEVLPSNSRQIRALRINRGLLFLYILNREIFRASPVTGMMSCLGGWKFNRSGFPNTC